MRERNSDLASIALTPGIVEVTGPGVAIADRGFRIDEMGQGQLIAGRCPDCGECAWPWVRVCHACLGDRVEENLLAHRGLLYAFTEIHIAPSGWKAPYIVGYVDMPEGVRIFTHLDGPASGLHLGHTVVLRTRPENGQPAFSFAAATPEN